jgi:hypothetical protein
LPLEEIVEMPEDNFMSDCRNGCADDYDNLFCGIGEADCVGCLKFVRKQTGDVAKLHCSDGLGALPTREDIENLALDNPILMAAIKTGAAQQLSWEATMMFAVKFLVEKNNEAQKLLIDKAMNFTAPMFAVEKST